MRNSDTTQKSRNQYAMYFSLANGMKFKVLLSEDAYWELYRHSIDLGSMHEGLVSMLKNVELVPDERKVLKVERLE